MEEEHIKMFNTPNVALIAKGNRPRGNKNSRGKSAQKAQVPLRKVGQRLGLPRTKRLKAMEKKI